MLGSTNGTQNADLLAALQHTDIGDDADHDGGDHQRDGYKGHQYVADHAHDLGHGAHQGADRVGENDHLVVLSLLAHGGVVGVQVFHDAVLGLKAVGIDPDGAGICIIRVAQRAQNAVVGGGTGLQIQLDQIHQVIGAHVQLYGVLEHGGIDLQCVFHLTAELGNVLLDRGLQLLAELRSQLAHQLLHHSADLSLNGGSELCLQGFAQLLGELLGIAFQIACHDALQVLL